MDKEILVREIVKLLEDAAPKILEFIYYLLLQ